MLKNSVPKFLLNIMFSLIGCIIGSVIGVTLYNILPFWTIIPIGQAAANTNDILFVKYQYLEASFLENATLYIQTQSGDVYSLTQKKSQILPPLPDEKVVSQVQLKDWDSDAPIVAITTLGEVYQLLNGQWELIQDQTQDFKGITPKPCAAEWYLPAVGVRDSAGTVFSHALADEYVCYLLFNDGRLQVWTRTLDAFSLMGVLVISALVGLVVGFNAVTIKKRFQSLRISKKVLVK